MGVGSECCGGGTGRRGGRGNCDQARKAKLLNLIKKEMHYASTMVMSIYFNYAN